MNSISSKLSDLKINVEDVFSSNFLLKNNKKMILCTLNLNFFERPKKRKIFLIGKYGSIEVCLNTQKIIILKNKKKIEKKFNFVKNDIFIKELKFFLSKVKTNQKISKNMNLYNGIKTLRLALKLNNFLL